MRLMSILKNIPMLKKLADLGSAMIMVIILSTIVGLILAFPVMWLWNFVFGALYKISVFQAWGLNVLAGILFGKTGNGRK